MVFVTGFSITNAVMNTRNIELVYMADVGSPERFRCMSFWTQTWGGVVSIRILCTIMTMTASTMIMRNTNRLGKKKNLMCATSLRRFFSALDQVVKLSNTQSKNTGRPGTPMVSPAARSNTSNFIARMACSGNLPCSENNLLISFAAFTAASIYCVRSLSSISLRVNFQSRHSRRISDCNCSMDCVFGLESCGSSTWLKRWISDVS